MSTCPVQLVLLLQLVLLVQLVLFTSRTILLPLLLVLLQLHVSVLEISPSMTIDHRRCVVGSSISVAVYTSNFEGWCIYNGGVYIQWWCTPQWVHWCTPLTMGCIFLCHTSQSIQRRTLPTSMDGKQQCCSTVLMCTSGSKHLSACSTSGSEHLSMFHHSYLRGRRTSVVRARQRDLAQCKRRKHLKDLSYFRASAWKTKKILHFWKKDIMWTFERCISIHWEVSCAMYKRFFFPEIRHNLFPSPLVLARIYKGEAQLSFDWFD